jgi:hypothetical protein
MHTTYSDGRWSAEELLNYLTREGFDLVAVTDLALYHEQFIIKRSTLRGEKQ